MAMPNETERNGNPQKAEGLEVHAVAGQIVVYETQADRTHYLNPTAALILELCDGTRSRVEIAALVQEAYGLPAAPVSEADSCLADFRRKGIVV
jgi:hypothetical protein